MLKCKNWAEQSEIIADIISYNDSHVPKKLCHLVIFFFFEETGWPCNRPRSRQQFVPDEVTIEVHNRIIADPLNSKKCCTKFIYTENYSPQDSVHCSEDVSLSLYKYYFSSNMMKITAGHCKYYEWIIMQILWFLFNWEFNLQESRLVGWRKSSRYAPPRFHEAKRAMSHFRSRIVLFSRKSLRNVSKE